MRLFVGDDWAEDHHAVEVMDEAGKLLAKRRLPEGVAGIAQLHEVSGRLLGEDADEAEVAAGIETDHGPWVTTGRLRYQVREGVPAALGAFGDLDAGDTLELLGKAPDPARAARLTRARVSAALKRARRRNIPDKATAIPAALRAGQHGQPPALTAAYAATVRALLALIATLNDQVRVLQGEVDENFGRHTDAEIYRSQPGVGARVLGEFGDSPHRYADGKARRIYAATSPVARAPGKKKFAAARFVHNDRLEDALNAHAFASLNASPGARAFYDQQHAKGIEHNDALRRLANRLDGILHRCLKTRTLYDEAAAWGHRRKLPRSSAAAWHLSSRGVSFNSVRKQVD